MRPGSAEMPSAGRPFSHELVTALVTRGILIAPITLRTGVASPEKDARARNWSRGRTRRRCAKDTFGMNSET
ncbi:S-adenosylmethionine:tRNA ribosyltransferase-isomerase [Sphaerisporangium sp. NPDC051011]|uniref:S-adenosylmethionine:tRNA ribosyltransferase-isomerase n=1 Tax=Sphaerisporangium sp. NPDC051011 TaxID=3155792 RepID=UPI0033F3AAB5